MVTVHTQIQVMEHMSSPVGAQLLTQEKDVRTVSFKNHIFMSFEQKKEKDIQRYQIHAF